jgi:hypothetical protein
MPSASERCARPATTESTAPNRAPLVLRDADATLQAKAEVVLRLRIAPIRGETVVAHRLRIVRLDAGAELEVDDEGESGETGACSTDGTARQFGTRGRRDSARRRGGGQGRILERVRTVDLHPAAVVYRSPVPAPRDLMSPRVSM